MTSYYHIIQRIDQNDEDAYVLSNSPGGGTGAKSAVSGCILFVFVCHVTNLASRLQQSYKIYLQNLLTYKILRSAKMISLVDS